MAFGWPNTLSPHATGGVIEDAWPTLFFGAERVPELRRKTDRLPWARAALERWRAEAEGILGAPPDLPIEPIGWRHDFFAPASAEHLLFDPTAGESAVDPWDGTVYETVGARRKAWALLVHERTYRLMRSLGVLYALTGDERYSAWVAEGLRRAAAVFRRDDLREGNTHQALYFQPLYDSQVLLLLANACGLIRESPSYPPALHHELVAAVFDAAMPYQIAFLESQAPQNMMCYVGAALAVSAKVCDRPAWRDLALTHPRRGLPALLRDNLPLDAEGEPDGFWVEGTMFYHFYSAFPLAALYEVARSRGQVSAEETRRLVALLRAPLLLADPQGRLPPFGDLGAPKSLHLRLYRHLYEYGAGVLDGIAEAGSRGGPDSGLFGSVLAALYRGGIPRDSLAAVAFGPDDLPPLRGQPPPRASVSLPASGIAVLRAPLPPELAEGSAERDWMQVWLRSGRHGHGHDHPDKLGFALHAGGEVIAADAGTAGYGLKEHTRFCRSTLAHNTLLVDEGDQGRVQRASLRFHSGRPGSPGTLEAPDAHSAHSAHSDGGWAVGTLDDAYPGVVLERRLALRPPFLLLEDLCLGDPDGAPRRFGWVLHAYGSLAALPGPDAGGPILPALPEEGPFAWLTQRRTWSTAGTVLADWRVRDGLWLRLWATADGPLEVTAGSTPGNPIPDRRGTLLLRAQGTRRRFRVALEVHRGAPRLGGAVAPGTLFTGQPFGEQDAEPD